MTTSRLLHERMREKGYSKIRLQNELGCCEKTLRNYLNGTTTSGPYLMKLLAILNISVSEWNSCENIKQEEVLQKGKYKEVREVIVNSLSDKQWHGVDEIQSKCEEEGINLEGNRGPIYNVVHQLKKKGKIEANGIGEYRICKQSVEPVKKGRMEFSNKQKNQLEVSIGNIEMYVDKYKKFDWINCSDEELQDARSNVTRLLDLAKKVEKEFKKI